MQIGVKWLTLQLLIKRQTKNVIFRAKNVEITQSKTISSSFPPPPSIYPLKSISLPNSINCYSSQSVNLVLVEDWITHFGQHNICTRRTSLSFTTIDTIVVATSDKVGKCVAVWINKRISRCGATISTQRDTLQRERRQKRKWMNKKCRKISVGKKCASEIFLNVNNS